MIYGLLDLDMRKTHENVKCGYPRIIMQHKFVFVQQWIRDDRFNVSKELRLTSFYFNRYFFRRVSRASCKFFFLVVAVGCNDSKKDLSQIKQSKTYCCCYYFLQAIHRREPSETIFNDHNHIFTSSIEFLFQLYFFFLSYKS